MKNNRFHNIKNIGKVLFALVFLVLCLITPRARALNTTIDYDYTGNVQSFTAPVTGIYNIELWGAAGGDYSSWLGGNGGYTEGKIFLTRGTKLYVYVGNKPTSATGGWNGGGNGYTNEGAGFGGGGATDIRLIPASTTSVTAWNTAASLRSRIMVAGAGSGASRHNGSNSWYSNGGAAGGINSYRSTSVGSSAASQNVSVATQTSAGRPTSGSYQTGAGGFGYGSNGYANSDWETAGGGSGWFGGSGSSYAGGYSSGGSSYISGHLGSIGVNEDGTSKATSATSIEVSESYTGYVFYDTKMVDGVGYNWSGTTTTGQTGFPSITDSETLVNGNRGNGHARITIVENREPIGTVTVNGTVADNDINKFEENGNFYVYLESEPENINLEVLLSDELTEEEKENYTLSYKTSQPELVKLQLLALWPMYSVVLAFFPVDNWLRLTVQNLLLAILVRQLLRPTNLLTRQWVAFSSLTRPTPLSLTIKTVLVQRL